MTDYILTFLAFFFGLGAVAQFIVGASATTTVRQHASKGQWEPAAGMAGMQAVLFRRACLWLAISFAIVAGLVV